MLGSKRSGSPLERPVLPAIYRSRYHINGVFAADIWFRASVARFGNGAGLCGWLYVWLGRSDLPKARESVVCQVFWFK
jgi:hypothetical protein